MEMGRPEVPDFRDVPSSNHGSEDADASKNHEQGACLLSGFQSHLSSFLSGFFDAEDE